MEVPLSAYPKEGELIEFKKAGSDKWVRGSFMFVWVYEYVDILDIRVSENEIQMIYPEFGDRWRRINE